MNFDEWMAFAMGYGRHTLRKPAFPEKLVMGSVFR
jgi:hypothetical protein